MDTYWIYLIGVLSLSLAGCLALLMWFEGKKRRKKSEMSHSEELESSNSGKTYQTTYRPNESLRHVIEEVIGTPSQESKWMESLWKENILVLQNSHFRIEKALLLSLFPKVKIQHYKNFSIQILSELEEKLLHSKIPLVKLIEKGKNLYFKGHLARSKVFRLFFEDSERNKEQQIYFFHFQSEESYRAVLFLILNNSSRLVKEDLRAILNPNQKALLPKS